MKNKEISSLVLSTLLLTLLGASVLATLFYTAPNVYANPGWLSGWTYRRQLTVDHTKITESLSDFPVLVKLSSSFFDFTKAKDNGEDIRFTDSGGATLLKYEIERWSKTDGKAEIWVKLPTVLSGSNTDFYIYYGNSDASDGQDPTNVWDSHYKAVYHMQDSSASTIHDSTNVNNGNKKDTNQPNEVAGFIGKGQSFDGTDDCVNCGSDSSLTINQVTLEAYVSFDSLPTGENAFGVLGRWDITANQRSYCFYIYGQTVRFMVSDNGYWTNPHRAECHDSQTPSLATWYHYVGTYDGAPKIYRNGVSYTTVDWDETNASPFPGTAPLMLGCHLSSGTPIRLLDGQLDEVRISDVARSPAWIKAAYETESGSLLLYGSEKTYSPPVVLNSPSSGTTKITWTVDFSYTPTLEGSITGSWLWLDLGGTWQRAQANTAPVKNGEPNTISYSFSTEGTYTWNVEVMNSTGSYFASSNWIVKIEREHAGESWLSGWRYRKSHVITSATEAGTNYQTRMKVTFTNPWFNILSTNLPLFVANDVASDGTIFTGDNNYQIYKSTDNGATFTKIFTIPAQPDPWGTMAGRAREVFVDSRDYVFVSAGSTNRLYRSIDGGASFDEVLNFNKPNNDGNVNRMTEDSSGNLYAPEYDNTPPSGGARLWKSTDNGTTWFALSKTWSARHLHAAKFNPYNGWLYVVVGEESDGSQTEYNTVWRSKDSGNTWQCIIERGSGTTTKYTTVEFIGNDLYLGQDRNGVSDTDDIHKITDNGGRPYVPTLAYDNPYPAAIMVSATKLGNTVIFSTSAENYDATCQVVMSSDGSTWTVLNAQVVSTTYMYINRLTAHPRTGFVYGCINNNCAYFIASPSTPRPPSLQDPPDTVSAEGHCKADFGDVRFTDDDGVTPLDYWMETKVDGDYAIFWVEVADDLGSADRTIYVYYGKSNAITTSDPYNTLLFYDDFNTDLNKWTKVNGEYSFTIESGYLTIQPLTGRNFLIVNTAMGTSNIAIRTRVKSEQVGETIQAHPGLLWHANTLTYADHRNDQVYLRPHDTNPNSPTGNIQPAYYDGGSSPVMHNTKGGSYFVWSTWCTVEARIPSSGNIKLYGNDVYWHDWGNQQYSYDHVGLIGGAYGKDYFDYFAVRKYVDPEPAHSTWGTEEILTIDSCNSAGTKKDTFSLGDEIWVNGSKGYSPSTTYNIYVVADTDWSNNDSFPTRVPDTAESVTSSSDGSILARVWASASPGKYDIVIDFDGDGVYDEGIDPIDNNQVVETAGFFVIPEYALGTILALSVCFAGVAIYKRSKRVRRKTL